MTRLTLFLLFVLFIGGLASAAPPSATAAPRARMLAVPKPVYPAAAIQRRIQGRGQFRLDMDIATGKPLRAVVVKSTGSALLDEAALKALRQWRAAPGAIRVINLPLVFRLSSSGPSVDFQ